MYLNSPFCNSAPPPNIFMWEKMNFLPHENVEIQRIPPRGGWVSTFSCARKFILESPIPILMLLGWLLSSVYKKKADISSNLVIFFGFWALTRLKNVIEVIRRVEKMRLDEIWLLLDKKFLLRFVFFELFTKYRRKIEKKAKMAEVASFGLKYLGPQSFAGHPVCGSRREI